MNILQAGDGKEMPSQPRGGEGIEIDLIWVGRGHAT